MNNRKVVYNACFGGFGLSPEACKMYLELKGRDPESNLWSCDIPRHDPDLVRVVETLGEKASDSYSRLKVKDIGTDLYRIYEYDGRETVILQDTQEWM